MKIVFIGSVFALFILIKATQCIITMPQKLANDILDKYDRRVKPRKKPDNPVTITFRLDLYQVLEVNEPQQYVTLNTWIGESWQDELLYWNPAEYDNISQLTLPHNVLWLPDTILYNSIIMQDADTRRLLNVRLTTNETSERVTVDLLYPTIFTFSCSLKIQYFPFDSQNCSLVIGSWTYDITGIDYKPISEAVGLHSYLENEGWNLITFRGYRIEHNYTCCPNAWVLLHYSISLQRKPLFYIVNLVIPTLIITLIAIVGFFMPSSASGERHEKMTLGITTLLSMSILLMMVSDKMPTTSDCVPLIGWFYLTMIGLISAGTISSALIILIQRKGEFGERLSPTTAKWVGRASCVVWVRMPKHLTCKAKQDQHNIQKQSSMERPDSKPLVPKKSQQLSPRSNDEFTYVPDKGYYVDNGAVQATRDSSRKRQQIERENYIFALKEYEWLATVIERVTFIIFLLLLFMSTGGILGGGYFHALSVARTF